MQRMQQFAVAVSGGALMAALVPVDGILAGVAVPASFFQDLGRQRAGLALLVTDFVVMALPVVLLSGCWAALTLWLARKTPRRAALPFLFGMLLAWAWMAGDSIVAVRSAMLATHPLDGFSWQSLAPRWWSLPSFAAPWLGLLLAFLLVGGSRGPGSALPPRGARAAESARKSGVAQQLRELGRGVGP